MSLAGHAIGSNVSFSTGPSTNPFNMYSTSNSTQLSVENSIQKKLPSQDSHWRERTLCLPSCGYRRNNNAYHKLDIPSPSDQSSFCQDGHLKNTKMLLGERDEIDCFRSTNARDSFKSGNSINGCIQKTSRELSDMKGGDCKISVSNTFPTGYKTNISGYSEKQHYAISDKKIHSSVLRKMQKRDPIEAENEGRGPFPMTTSTGDIHKVIPLQDSRLPDTVEDLWDYNGKRKNILLAGGFNSNCGLTKNLTKEREELENPTPWSSTQKVVHSNTNHRDAKYFNETETKAQQATSDLSVMRENRMYNRNATGYPHKSSVVTSSFKNISDNELIYPLEELHPSISRIVRRHDPIEYDTMARKEIMKSTSQCTYGDDNKRKKDWNLRKEKFENTSDKFWYQKIDRYDHERMKAGYCTNNIPPTELQRGGEDLSITRTSFSKPDYDKHYKTYMKDGFHPNDYRYGSIRRPELAPFVPTDAPSSLNETLTSDIKDLENKHPTIKKIMRHRYPAQYTEAVPSYQHKNREQR